MEAIFLGWCPGVDLSTLGDSQYAFTHLVKKELFKQVFNTPSQPGVWQVVFFFFGCNVFITVLYVLWILFDGWLLAGCFILEKQDIID